MVKPETNFLREILMAIEALKKDDLPAPDWDIEADGYTALGVLEDLDLRAMLALRRRFTDACNAASLASVEYMVEIMRRRPPESEVAQKQRELKSVGDLALARKTALDDFFWASLKMSFPELVGKGSIAVGKDWKLGWKEGEDSLSRILGEIGNIGGFAVVI